MGEIDDIYHEKVEILENEFFDNFKAGKKRSEVVDDYLRNLEKARLHFEKEYKKKLTKDKILAGKLKKKKEKAVEFKHLEVVPFNFEFSSWERFKMKLKIKWFRFSRSIKKDFVDDVPAAFIYWPYKFKLFVKHFWRETMREKDLLWSKVKKRVIKLVKKTWKKILKSYNWILKVGIVKLMFWKKEAPKGKESEKKDEKKTEEKNGEEKKEG